MKQALPTPAHGGNLADAIVQFGRPREAWLDLSTGINPHPYPVPSLKPDAWHRLPEPDPALAQAAQTYYNAPRMLAVAGTQAAIQALPQYRMRKHGPARVAVATPTYAEHAHRWEQAGHQVVAARHEDLNESIAAADVVIICNPNNPTGKRIDARQLLAWHAQLAVRNGWLIVDEAFCDVEPEDSVAPFTERAGLIVLKSVGKFFGLAGLRLGFVAAESALLESLHGYLGPWSVSGPAQEIGLAAIRDGVWQQAMRKQLLDEGKRLHTLLRQHGIESKGSALFQWWPLPAGQARQCWRHMALHGVWVRLFTDEAAGIRIGLPPDEAGWARLADALRDWRIAVKSA
ncbi:threonine-phosphate decarboxylase [Oxalobacteraceae bacterium CAVE-383]|nr:threonine-phosphate decarboxylase [Oxalobacteraceae bacterium CAVE-383]